MKSESSFHKKYPISFAQNKKLSPTSIGVGLYLHSLPAGWHPRPAEIMEHFNFGRHTWLAVSKELREEGYLKLNKNPLRGSELVFDIERQFDRESEIPTVEQEVIENTETPSNIDILPELPIQAQTHESSDSLKNEPHIDLVVVNNIKKQQTNNLCSLKIEPSENTYNDGNIIEIGRNLIEKLKNLNIGETVARKWISEHGVGRVLECFEHSERQKNIRSHAAWINQALLSNYQFETKDQTKTERHLTPDESSKQFVEKSAEQRKQEHQEWVKIMRERFPNFENIIK